MDVDMVTSGRMLFFFILFRQMLSEARGVRINKALAKMCRVGVSVVGRF